ncbi:MAG: hypothetical protein PHY29_02485 [Syntrophales bacterium]|nr:hypothetical protein [Syntrophales bacterium]
MSRKTAAYIALFLAVAGLIGLGVSTRVSDGVVRYLKAMTISENVIPDGSSFDIVYVLGGTQPSLQEKYERLGSLCRTIKYQKILILDRLGITEYRKEAGRNLTNNEWSLMQLERRGIKKQDVELVSMTDGYFGTLSEARAVTGLMGERGYRTALLITAPHHTARVKRSFGRMLKYNRGTCYVTSSEEEAAFGELLMENLKLMVYTLILLPMQD